MRLFVFASLIAGVLVVALLAPPAAHDPPPYDPIAHARATVNEVANLEAVIPPACYGSTEGGRNVCWTCHTDGVMPNPVSDWELQTAYSFSDAARVNHWTNTQVDRRRAAAEISDAEILRWIRQDNLTPLREHLARRSDYPGFVPDLDLHRGFDGEGFALDGSGWRAVRYKPFPGMWPTTTGGAGDLMIRLPRAFRVDADGVESRAIYRDNLAILEKAIASDPRRSDDEIDLADHYAGGASDVPVERYLYPAGTEFLHTVRYLDPDEPTLLARRLRELRYMRKIRRLDRWAILREQEREAEEKDEGALPRFAGSPEVGLVGKGAWQIQGFIEDAHGRLRLQTAEEHRFCMGCHGPIGVTVDRTFAFARKVPGDEGWRPQDPRGIPDAPQVGHDEPETAAYLARAGGCDAIGADPRCDATGRIVPTRSRALLLDKAYLTIVREQSFDRGRDPVLAPAARSLSRIEREETGLSGDQVRLDGRLWLDWDSAAATHSSR
jgi:hypothetical protein